MRLNTCAVPYGAPGRNGAGDPVAVGVQPRHISVVGVVGVEPLLRVAQRLSKVGIGRALLLVDGSKVRLGCFGPVRGALMGPNLSHALTRVAV
jgi:hypothetical protein